VTSLRAYEPGETLFAQDEPARGFHVVAQGRIRIYRVGPDGRQQILHLFGAGDLCGEVPVFHGGKYPASAAADGPARALYVPGEDFLKLSREHPDMLLDMLAILSVRLRRFVDLIDDLSLKEVSARLAKYMLDLRVKSGADRFELDTSKAMLAARLGTIAETLSRTFRRMQKRGILRVKGKVVEIGDFDALVEIAAGEKL
jgi:CRP/FNR family transcriptional regulator